MLTRNPFRLFAIPIGALFCVCMAIVELGCGGGGGRGTTVVASPDSGGIRGVAATDSAGNLTLVYRTIPAGFKAAAGASVTIGTQTVMTDGAGAFSIRNLVFGTNVVNVTYGSVPTLAVPITVVPGATSVLGTPPVSQSAALSNAITALNKSLGASPSLRGPTAPNYMTVYEAKEPLAAGVVLGDALEDDSEPEPVTLASPMWLVYVDQSPGARFSHPISEFLVDPVSGTTTERDSDSWPTLNGTSFYDNTIDFASDVIQQGIAASIPQPQMTASSPRRMVKPADDMGKSYAFILIGGGSHGTEDFSVDANNIQGIFGTAAIPATTAQDVFNTGTSTTNPIADIKTRFNALAAKTVAGDTFTFYLSTHGLPDSVGIGKYEAYINYNEVPIERKVVRNSKTVTETSWTSSSAYLHIDDLDFTKVNACNIVLIIDTCYSARWIDGLTTLFAKFPGKHFDIVTSTIRSLPGFGTFSQTTPPYPPKLGGPMTVLFTANLKKLATTGNFDGDIGQAWSQTVDNFETLKAYIKTQYRVPASLLNVTPEYGYRDVGPTECCPCGGEGVTVK